MSVEGECVVVTPNRDQDGHVCIFKMARNLEGVAGTKGGEWKVQAKRTHSSKQQESGRCVGGVPHDGDAIKLCRYAGSRGY